MAALSDVKICNLSLSHIGESSTIQALTENSPEASICDLWYDVAREEVLEDFDWNFARARVVAAAHVDPATSEWSFRYQYPADALKIRGIENPLGYGPDALPFQVEYGSNGTRTVLTNAEQATLIYTKNVTTTSLFPPKFSIALSWKLASHIAFSVTGEIKIEERATEMYVRFVRSAIGSNANEQTPRKERDAEAIRARN